MNQTLITAYNKPDLDGVASAIAYAEFLNQDKQNYLPVFFGKLQMEAQFMVDKLKIVPQDGDALINNEAKIILVDASEADMLSDKINIDNVIEVIDHRPINSADLFKFAKVDIDLVGSCATLIAEKFIEAKIEPSYNSAVLLYTAIISNTINLKAKVTTKRDIAVAKYLKDLAKINDSLVHEMFAHKSNFKDPIKAIFPDNLKHNLFSGKKVSIFQIEMIGVDGFLTKNKREISEFLSKVANEQDYDHTFLTCIDLELGENRFLCVKPETAAMLEKIFKVKFRDSIAVYPSIIMRKEITPLIKAELEK